MSFRSEYAKIKNDSLKVRLEFIFTYYWLPIVIASALLVTLVALTVHFTTQKETVLSGHCVNAVFEQTEAEAFLTDVSQKMNIDERTGEIALSNSLLSTEDLYGVTTTHQLVTAQIAAKALDFLAGDARTLAQFAYSESLCDIRTVLTPEQADALSSYFLYYDLAIVQKASALQTEEYPNPSKPEEMEMPVPFAVQIPEGSAFDRVYFAQTDKMMAIAVACNAPHPAAAALFIYLTCAPI